MNDTLVYGQVVRWNNFTEQATVQLEDGSLALMDKQEFCLSGNPIQFITSIIGIKHIPFHIVCIDNVLGKKKVSLRSVMLDTYKAISVGDIISTVITGITRYSLFLRFEDFITIRVYLKEISNSYINNLYNLYSVGQVVKVKIIEKDDVNYFINGSIKVLCEDTLLNYKVGDILIGRVASKGQFTTPGYFVEISPLVSGIFDWEPNVPVPFNIDDKVIVKVTKIKPNGLKLNFIRMA